MRKFNSGIGALLCDGCHRMVATGFNGETVLRPYVVDGARHLCGCCHRKAHGYARLLRVMRVMLGNISQRALADRTSLHRAYLSRCEQGKWAPAEGARGVLASLLGLPVTLFEALADFDASSDHELALAVLFAMATSASPQEPR